MHLSMVFVRRAQAASWLHSTTNVVQRYSVAVGPFPVHARLHLAVVERTMAPGMRLVMKHDELVAAAVRGNVTRTIQPGAAVSHPQYSFAKPGLIATTTLIRGIIERTRRIEQHVQVQARLAARPAASSSQALEAERAAQARKTGADWWKEDSGEARSRVAVNHQPVNVDQIADKVMRQLDSRVGAWRERMGRM
jgi:hypothetical protein